MARKQIAATYLNAEEREALQKLADKERRSLASMIAYIIREYMKQEKKS